MNKTNLTDKIKSASKALPLVLGLAMSPQQSQGASLYNNTDNKYKIEQGEILDIFNEKNNYLINNNLKKDLSFDLYENLNNLEINFYNNYENIYKNNFEKKKENNIDYEDNKNKDLFAQYFFGLMGVFSLGSCIIAMKELKKNHYDNN